MSVHDKRRELFDKITRAKQLNQSQCDQMKNLNIRVAIIALVYSERFNTPLQTTNNHIKIDDGFKCSWYWYYKQKYNLNHLVDEMLDEFIKLNNHVKQRSKYIFKLRQDMLKYKCKGF